MVGDNNQSNTEYTNLPIQKWEKPILLFKRTNEAAVRNSKTLSAFNGDLGEEIAAQKGIPLNYRSEFRNTSDLS